jgi:hypothetical protein
MAGGRLAAIGSCALLFVVTGAVPALEILASQSAAAPPVRAWIGQESHIETHLATAEVTKREDIGTGVTKPQRAYLSPAEPVASLVWKPLPPGRRGGHWESYKSEIAAYQLDALLDLHMVPPAVERRIDGEVGAAIMWLDGIRSVKQMGGVVPSGPAWDKPLRKMLMFDNLIGNPDRNAGNILVGPPGELVLIDHSRAFIMDKSLPRKVERVDAALWDRVTALTQDDLTRALGAWLDRGQLDALVKRRDRMAADVNTLVAKHGRARVIVP